MVYKKEQVTPLSGFLPKKQVTPPEFFEFISIPLHTAWEDFLVMFHGYTVVFPIFSRKSFFRNSIRHFDSQVSMNVSITMSNS